MKNKQIDNWLLGILVIPDVKLDQAVRAPFCCGSVFWDWFDDNCDRCQKYGTDKNIKCKYARELVASYFEDGSISKQTFDLITENNRLLDACPNFVEKTKRSVKQKRKPRNNKNNIDSKQLSLF